MKKLNYENTPQIFEDNEFEEYLSSHENLRNNNENQPNKTNWTQKVQQLFQKNTSYTITQNQPQPQPQKPKKLQKFDNKQYLNLKKPKSYWKKYNQQQKLLQQQQTTIQQERTQKKNYVFSEQQKKGHFAFGDKIFKIHSCRATNNQQVSLKIEWRKRRNGHQPEISFLYSTDVKKYDPEGLATYYEKLMTNALTKNRSSSSQQINNEQNEPQIPVETKKSTDDSNNESNSSQQKKQRSRKGTEIDKYKKRIATLTNKTMILQILVNQGARTTPVTVQEVQYQVILHAKNQRQKQLQTVNNILLCLEALDQEGAIKFVDIKPNISKNSVQVII